MNPLRSFGGVLAVCLAFLTLCGSVHAQYTLHVGGSSGVEGTNATASILFDNAGDDLRGWSFGVCTDAADLAVTGAASGSTTAAINLGSPPDFESVDVFTGGVTHGVVICFTSCAVLAQGTDFELLTIDYDLIGTAGDYPVCFCDTLGTPAVPTVVVDTLSQGLAPAQICDNMTIIEPVDPISGFNCFESADPCNCSFDLSWTNNGTYDSIAVYEAGVLLQTLAGTATSITVDVPGSAEYCIEPMRDGIVGPPVCCTPTCSPSSVNPTPVTILDCLVDAPTCTLTVTWTNESQYSSLRVLVDGTEVLALAGTETSAIVSLGAPGSYEVCVDGTTICGDAVAAACCTVECPREFQRGDANGDGTVNIADAVGQLDLFVGTDNTIDCDDALDTNDDGQVNIADPVYFLNYQFTLGPVIPDPFLTCGLDTTEDSLGCNEYTNCP